MSMIAQEDAAVTEAQFGNHARFPQPKFAYVIYVYDEDDDIKFVWVDSIWTNKNKALQRMKILEASENAIIELSDKKYPYVYKLRGLTRNFQWPDGCVIRRENKDGAVYDDKYLIVCERAALNDKDFLKPFSTDKFKELVSKVKRKRK